MRRWLLYAVLIGFAWALTSRVAEIRGFVGALSGGRLEWLGVALALQAAYYCVYALLYWSAFETVGVRSRFGELLSVLFASLFVNVAAPSGGASGAALFVDDAGRRGEPTAKATAGTLLVEVAELGTFAAILAAGMYYLFTRHDLKTYQVAAASTLMAVIFGLVIVLLLGLLRPRWIEWLLSRMHSAVRAAFRLVRRPDPLPEDWALAKADEFGDAARAAASRPRALARTLAVAVLGHIIDLASLFAVFMAFDQSVGMGALVAGYSMLILFWVISPTPQGIGVVEAVVALVYASLGVPGAKAVAISLTFRGMAFWLPLLIGLGTVRRVRSFDMGSRASAAKWEVHAAAAAVAVVGIVDVVSAVTPSLVNRVAILAPFISDAARHGAHLATALAGFGLLLLSGGLWRRKHAAWYVTMALLAVSFATHVLKGLDLEEALLTVALIAWLGTLRGSFNAASDRPSVKRAVLVLAMALAFTVAYGATGFYLLDRHFAVDYGLRAALDQTITMFFEFYDPGLEPVTGFGRYFADSIYMVGIATTAYALLLLLSPVLLKGPDDEARRARARGIVERYGASSLASATLLPDKRYFFSPGGSVIAFVANSGVGLALGDPIGPREDASSAIAEFVSHCVRQDWRPAFYQVLPDLLEDYKAAGLSALCVGHEAIVHLDSFSLEGSDRKQLRTTLNKLSRLEYCCEVIQPPVRPDLLEQLRVISNEWLTAVHGSEKRFSLGWFDDEYISSCPIAVVKDTDRSIVAFANIVPEYARNEATIDLMRRGGSAPNGTMDFMFVSLFQWARESGYETFNPGLSPLAGVGESGDDPVIDRSLRFAYNHLNRFYGFKGLHSFKEKFGPEWSPRYLIYDGSSALARTAYAIVNADSGGALLASYLGIGRRRKARA